MIRKRLRIVFGRVYIRKMKLKKDNICFGCDLYISELDECLSFSRCYGASFGNYTYQPKC